MEMTPSQFVEAYLLQDAEEVNDLGRLVTKPSGLNAAEMNVAIADPRLGRLGIPMMADFMAPNDSIYFDAIFGAYSGQVAIRGWLVPAMADIEFIDFVPTAEAVIFDDGLGGSSLDEWQMVANIGDDKVPLSRGVSVRRYRGGFITWACDVYDTGVFRQPPPPESGVVAPELPPWPRVEWTVDRSVVDAPLSAAASAWISSSASSLDAGVSSGLSHQDLHHIVTNSATATDLGLLSRMLHPTDSIYIDPQMGEVRGQTEIGERLAASHNIFADSVREPLGPPLFNGETSVQEWQRVARRPDGAAVVIRGTSVRRFTAGWVTYAAEYFDTAPLT
jgi:hypothetical protein